MPAGRQMIDAARTKAELVEELAALRRRVKELEDWAGATSAQVSEPFARLLIDATTDIAVLLDTEGRFLVVNEQAARGVGRPVDAIVGRHIREIFGDELAATRWAVARRVIESRQPVHHLDEQNGRVLDSRVFPVFGERGEVTRIAVFSRNVTDSRRAERVLRIQRDLAIALSSATNLHQALDKVLTATCGIGGIDCGAVYLVDEATGAVALVACHNLPPAFVESVARFGPDTPQAAIAKAGKPVYGRFSDAAYRAEYRGGQDLRAAAVIPILFENRAIGLLNLASRTRDEIDEQDQRALEAIAAQVGGVIARTQALEALRQSEENYRNLVELANDGICIIQDEVFRVVNVRLAQMLGYAPESMLGRPYLDYIAPECREAVRRAYERHIAGERNLGFADAVILHRDGSRIDVELSASIVQFGGRDAELVLVRDVTARKRVEAALLESERKYRTLVENVNIGVFRTTLDPPGRMLQANPAAARMFGYESTAEFMQVPVVSLYQDPADRAEYLKDLIGKGYLRNREVAVRRKDGTPFWGSISAQVTFDAAGRPLWADGVIEDVTERKEAERKRAELEAQLLRAQRLEAVGRLAGGVAHDFNNILMGVLGGASLLKRSLPPDSADFRRADAIERAGERAALLTNQLLAFARGGIYQPEAADLNSIVREALEFAPTRVRRGMRFDLCLSDNLRPVLADRIQISQVIVNLLQNAYEATGRHKHVVVETRAAETDLPETLRGAGGEYLELAVSDNGPGIAPADRERIFDPFFTAKAFGRGLGLAVVHGIVQNHHGFVVCDEAQTGGARFRIFLPVAHGRQADAHATAPSERAAPRGLTVLVVDDEEIPCEMASAMLESIGHRVLRARGGRQALRVFAQHRDEVDVVLLDYVMPDLDGAATFDGLVQSRSDVRVIVSSGYLEDVVVSEDLRAQARGFLKKPYRLEELARALQRAVSGAGPAGVDRRPGGP